MWDLCAFRTGHREFETAKRFVSKGASMSCHLTRFLGVPLSKLRSLQDSTPDDADQKARSKPRMQAACENRAVSTIRKQPRGHNSIRFVRHRILYGKPILNAKGNVAFGLRQLRMAVRTEPC